MTTTDTRTQRMWHLIGQTKAILVDYVRLLRRYEQQEIGHECGHEYTLTIAGRTHITDGGPHRDSEYVSDVDTSMSLTVRAWCLRDALLVAAAAPMTAGGYVDANDLEEEDA